MNRRVAYLVVAATVGAMGVAGTLYAYASWAVPSLPVTVKVRTEKMPRGVTPSVTKQGGDAVVSWSAQEIGPGSTMDHYVVTAHSVDTPPLPDITRTVTASGGATETVIFGAAEVAGGKWYWTTVPKLRLWVGTESGKSDRLKFPGTPATPPAGTIAAARSAGSTPATTAPTADAPVGAVVAPPAAADQPAPTTPATAPAADKPVDAATTAPAATPTTTAPAEAPSTTGTEDTAP
ncbi:hypothetical protein [Paractinoplanes durhamensis]|uniref:Fibronectin type-III domain-containing protein n=1 Tax=Paractinoplanes durhamensis TaxID=113563 RepID=A0ABQ3YP88_9ACTN|nr:hypothetical protein [Actinoplanes durhamensis]GID99367.1 hypothetical protein Adu01nite_07180 [Actinoplanes durhamensis]